MSCSSFNSFLNCILPNRRDKQAAQIEISTPCNLITAAPGRLSTPPARYANHKHVRKDSISSPVSPPPVYTPFGAGSAASHGVPSQYSGSSSRMVGDKPAYYAYAYASQPTTPESNSSRRSLMQRRESCAIPREKQSCNHDDDPSRPSVDMNLDTTPRAAKALGKICSPFRSRKNSAGERVEFEPAVRKSDEEARVAKVPNKSQRFTKRFTMRSPTTPQPSPFTAASKNSSTSSFRKQQRHRREASIDKVFAEKQQYQAEQQNVQQQLQQYKQQQQWEHRRVSSNRIKNGGNGVGHTPVKNGSLRGRQNFTAPAPRAETPVTFTNYKSEEADGLVPPTAEQIKEMEAFLREEERRQRLRSSPETETDDEVDDDEITYAELRYPHHANARAFRN